MNEIVLKKSDILPVLETTISGANGVIDLSNVTGTFFVYKQRFSGAMTIRSGTIVSATSGLVRYTWTNSDNLSVGPYFAEWRLYQTGAAMRSYPSDGYLSIEIVSGLV